MRKSLLSLSACGLVAAEGSDQGGGGRKRTIHIAAGIISIVVALVLVVLALLLSIASSEQVVEDGDYIRYDVSGWYGTAENVIEGHARITFTDFTETTLVATATYTGNVPHSIFAAAGEYEYSVEDGIWTTEALTEDILGDPSYKIGEGSVNTTFSTIEVDIYAFTESGVYVELYVAKGTGIPVKMNMVTTSINLVLILDDTSIEWIERL